MDVGKRFGKRLKALRAERGWSQEEFADRAGLHRTYVSAVERAVRNPTLPILAKMAKGFGMSLAELMESV